jgi:PKD repeat protein
VVGEYIRSTANADWGTYIGKLSFGAPPPASISVSPTSVVSGGSVTASWSGIPSPSATDWIGLYSPGSANTAFLAWIYVSCSKSATIAKASGSCPFALPSSLASGTYELRLLANNGFSRLATSNALSVTTANTAPTAPTTLGQFRTDGITAIAVGATTPETSVVLKGALSDADAGQTVKLQLEVRPLGTAFSNAATHESALLASGSLAAVTVPSLAPGTSYHWQARAVDNQGAASAWAPFGANAETAADFAIASSSTTLSVSPTSVSPGGSVTATWSGIATPSPLDWIGLYSPGSANTAFLAWIYVSCSKSATTAKASGSCPFALPSSLPSGTYELRLLANNGFTSLATSNAVASSSTILSVSPSSAASGSTVTATWSGIASPTPMDWIGLYAAGGPDTAFLAWTYLSCSKATTAVRPSGSCPFVLPNPLASGAYELRLFANNGFSRLATSEPLTVP